MLRRAAVGVLTVTACASPPAPASEAPPHATSTAPVAPTGSASTGFRAFEGPPSVVEITGTVTRAGKPLRDAAVYMNNPEGCLASSPALVDLVVEKGGVTPMMSIAATGDTLALANRDATPQSIVARYHTDADFLREPVPAGARIKRPLTHAGFIEIASPAPHAKNAFVMVAPNACHALTDAEGRFSFGGVIPGPRSFASWHPAVGARHASVHTGSKRVVEIQLAYDK